MFELNKKTEYGLQLMVYLAQKYGQGPIALKRIAKDKKMPYRFLSQVALELKNEGLLNSKEGVGGGYFLAKPAHEYKVSKILEVLEGPIELVECLKKDAICPWAGVCGQKQMFEQVEGNLKKIFQAHTLGDLVRNTRIQD